MLETITKFLRDALHPNHSTLLFSLSALSEELYFSEPQNIYKFHASGTRLTQPLYYFNAQHMGAVLDILRAAQNRRKLHECLDAL